MKVTGLIAVGAMFLASCSKHGEADGSDAIVEHVARNKVGADTDHWIEMRNMTGQWEKTGLKFGYLGDYDECVKAIEGLKQANPGRDYRCIPAN